MTIFSVIFYILGAVILLSTALAITRRNLVHAVIYLVISFFGSAMLFYLLGAPFLAAMEIIIYAGAIMVLFLFIIMMIDVDHFKERLFPFRQCLPAAVSGLIYAVIGVLLLSGEKNSATILTAAMATPRAFGRYVFERNWLAVEVVSLLLLVALVGALYLGKLRPGASGASAKEDL